MKLSISRTILLAVFSLFIFSMQGICQYQFKVEKKNNCTTVKNQARTGTCWSFATASFLESEVLKNKNLEVNLSEMFIVRNIYKDKARNYMFRQGKANFSQGSLAHDLIRMVAKEGVVTEDVYSGLLEGEERHDHSEMESGLKGFLDGVRKSKNLSDKWPVAFSCILDTYIGAAPESFTFNGKSYTPETFSDFVGINPEDYISITSFAHHPFYDSFILEIPDNYSNGSFYNVPLDEMMSIIDYALLEGYTIAWDGDVSEKGFSAKNGVAVLPTDASREDLFTVPGDEMAVNQEARQENFESYRTTDDHLMHIVGIALDQNGNKYYITKNSWGEISEHKGFLYMSESYVKMKTISIMINKSALPNRSAKKLFD